MEIHFPINSHLPALILLYSYGADSTKAYMQLQDKFKVYLLHIEDADDTTTNWMKLLIQDIRFAYHALRTAKVYDAKYIATGLCKDDFKQPFLWYLPAFLWICRKIAGLYHIQIIHPLMTKDIKT